MSQTLLLNRLTQTDTRRTVVYLTLYLMGLALLTVSSKIYIPLEPVPATLQSFAVLFLGMIYGSRLGAFTVASFIVLGLCGLPLLAGVITTGATLGYLIGFVPAAFVAGWLVERGWGKSIFLSLLAALAGTLIIFTAGLLTLTSLLGFKTAVAVGLVPFISVALAEIVILGLMVPRFWRSN